MKNTKKRTLKVKDFGQVFTPTEIVFRMLELCNYNCDSILNKKIIEPSFGDGAFLTEILSRLLLCCKNNRLSIFDTKKCIQNNIFGIEKDNTLYNITIKKLNSILLEYGIDDFDWHNNLFCTDTLYFENMNSQFDIVIGNPPLSINLLLCKKDSYISNNPYKHLHTHYANGGVIVYE